MEAPDLPLACAEYAMSHPDETAGKAVPAQLNFLTIYNPNLGPTDETRKEQIVFFHRAGPEKDRLKVQSKTSGPNDAESSDNSNAAANEQLRQVGLAQGMVNFARDFSNGESIDSVETKKRRIVLSELESGWWILASIDLTRLPYTKANSDTAVTAVSQYEYSSREVSPPALLIRQLQRAHSIFLLHQGRSLDDLYMRHPRDAFCDLLDYFWTKFAANWNVLLHGNPSADVYGGIKLALGGELGIGVGEEEWGSGERDVLEGLIRNTEGLVDLTVSRFGDPVEDVAAAERRSTWARDSQGDAQISTSQQWTGKGYEPGPTDGMIFSGLGTLTRTSLRSVTDWVTWIYIYGAAAYGIENNPNSARRRRRRKPRDSGRQSMRTNSSAARDGSHKEADTKAAGAEPQRRGSNHKSHPDIPPPIASAAKKSLQAATSSADTKSDKGRASTGSAEATSNNAFMNSEQWVKYLTLGYGSVWGVPSKTSANQATSNNNSEGDSKRVKPSNSQSTTKSREQNPQRNKPGVLASKRLNAKPSSGGHFIVGLEGNLDIEDDAIMNLSGDGNADEDEEEGEGSTRLSVRTFYVKLQKEIRENDEGLEHNDPGKRDDSEYSTQRLRVIVYMHAPFIYTLLFNPTANGLAFPSFFHDLHHHLTPLHGPLLRSTSPKSIAARLQSAAPNPSSPIYDLVYSPHSLTTHCSIPNIPAPGMVSSELQAYSTNTTPQSHSWGRVEALNVHFYILSTFAATRRHASNHERTAKTAKGWWVVWMRVPTTSSIKPYAPESNDPAEGSSTADAAEAATDREGDTVLSEAILVRKANEQAQTGRSWTNNFSYSLNSNRRVTYGGASALSRLVGLDASSASADASVLGGPGSPGRLSEGIGPDVDPRKYVENLLSLCR